ncbi:MAG: PQQ-binding-like beta-propeller repeat protein [Pyrinomonadaceae bacterium]|nr:PQQ-binding-like beta-propeller repeat protein [Pyrinomonadaceae bacterium]
MFSACLFGESHYEQRINKISHLSSFTSYGKHLYFGGGDHLYRIDTSTPSIETIFTTDRAMVDQPLIADGVAYFGVNAHVDQKGRIGEPSGFFAVALQSRTALWKFTFEDGGYGGYGVPPAIADNRILIYGTNLHYLDRESGKELWKVNNEFLSNNQGTTLPYVYKGNAYFENLSFVKDVYTRDGQWSKVAFDGGQREPISSFTGTSGEHVKIRGHGIGTLVDGIIYVTFSYHDDSYLTTHFGAVDLENRKLLWEAQGSGLRTRPIVNDKLVFTIRENAIQALERQTGKVVWSDPLGEMEVINEEQPAKRRWQEYAASWARRLAATREMVIVQGSQGIAAREAATGQLLWTVKIESEYSDVEPLIVRQLVITSHIKDCSVIALDPRTGKEVWRIKVPDCNSYYINRS